MACHPPPRLKQSPPRGMASHFPETLRKSSEKKSFWSVKLLGKVRLLPHRARQPDVSKLTAGPRRREPGVAGPRRGARSTGSLCLPLTLHIRRWIFSKFWQKNGLIYAFEYVVPSAHICLAQHCSVLTPKVQGGDFFFFSHSKFYVGIFVISRPKLLSQYAKSCRRSSSRASLPCRPPLKSITVQLPDSTVGYTPSPLAQAYPIPTCSQE